MTFFYGILTGIALSAAMYVFRFRIKALFISDLKKVEEKLNQK